jgi:short-subunit dehydrogenase
VKELKNRVIVITGAASGIGRALALESARRGMRVVLSDIDPTRLAVAVGEVEALGAEAIGVPTDVGVAAAVQHLADRAYERFGVVNIIVNNAGIATSGAAWKVPLETWERALRINLHGVVYGVHTFVSRMLESGEPGHVVNVASAAGLITTPAFAAYSATKFGVVGLSEALYHDLTIRQTNIGVSVLCPSWVQTNIATAADTPTVRTDAIDGKVGAAVLKAVEQGLRPEDVANQVFDAILNDRFYIITHEDTRRAVAVRSEDILSGRNPTMATMERTSARPPKLSTPS